MESRELVAATLDFAGPERLAVNFPPAPDCSHFRVCLESGATDWERVDGERWRRTDEWGNTWGRVDPTSKGEVVAGVLAELTAVDELPLPRLDTAGTAAAAAAARAAYPDRWLIAGLPGFTFNVARKLRRLDQYLMDLVLEPAAIRRLHDRLDELLEAMIACAADAGADAIMFPEDWGTQDALMIDPALWREEFGPRFHRLCAAARERGTRVFMHSCGRMTAIVPDLAAAGVELLQFDQPELHGIDELARLQDECGVSYACPVDIQKVLITGDEARVRAAARSYIDRLWRGRGGFVGWRYPDEASIGVDPRLQDAAGEAFVARAAELRREAAET